MGGHRTPLQQTRPGEHECAVADRAKALRPRAGIAQPGIECRAEIHEWQLRPTRHQQQVVALRCFAEMSMGVERQSVGTRHRATLHTYHFQLIVILGSEKSIGFGKHIHGASDVQRLHTCEHHDGNGFTHDVNSLL